MKHETEGEKKMMLTMKLAKQYFLLKKSIENTVSYCFNWKLL